MSYQVLARKWRPRTFHELVGQEHVSRALVNALDQSRLHHAYLFTGTRGVGKTTLARILAKCLNCEQGISSKPCGECSTCRDIDNGRFVDLIEVDAASRTKVEDTRELLDNVQYAPTQGRFKVYLIDEVHMLSTHSFNALLKTLEEPPPHVKFLLATTDPQKLPVTVLSRCLQFTLKNMSPESVVSHLTHVLKSEGVAFDVQALWLLGRAADGSMRDALSLTDQAIAFGQGEIHRADVAAMLGTLDHAHLIALAEALADVDAERLLAEVATLAEQGPDFAGVLDEVAGLMHRLAIAQMVPNALDNGRGDRDQLLVLAQRFSAEDVQLYYQIALQGRGDIDHAPDTRTALEMTLLRMLAFRPQGVPTPPQTDLPLRGGQTPPAAPASDGGGSEVSDTQSPERHAGADAAQASSINQASSANQTAGDAGASLPSTDMSSREAPEAANGEAPTSDTVPARQSVSSFDHAARDESYGDKPHSPASVDDVPPWAMETDGALADEAAMQSQYAESAASPMLTEPEVSAPVSSGDSAPSVIEEMPSDATGLEPKPQASASEPALEHAAPDIALGTSGSDEREPRAHEPMPKAPFSGEADPSQSEFAESSPANVDSSSADTQELDAQQLDADKFEPAPEPADVAMAPAADPARGETLTHQRWLEYFDQLDIGGLTRNLAAHCVVSEDDGERLQLTLDPGQSAMLSETHHTRIVQALKALGYVRRLEIEVAPLDGRLETPRAKRDREARERQAQAVEALRVDPHVQELQNRFGARLLEESVSVERA